MKKTIKIAVIITVILALVLCLVGCNTSVVRKFTYTNAYVKIGENWVDLEIKNWYECDGEQLQINLKDGTVMLVSTINCILYNGELPKGVKQ